MIELKIGSAAEKSMGWLEWSASLAGSLAWPTAAVIIAIIFRGQIKGLLSKLRKLSWGDKIADFSDKLDEVEIQTKSSAAPEEPAPLREQDIITERFVKLLEIAPGAAVLDAWIEIEKLISTLVNQHIGSTRITHHGDKAVKRRGTITNLAALANTEVLPDELYRMLVSLQQLRNRAAHESISGQDAIRFQSLAVEAKRQLERLLNEAGE